MQMIGESDNMWADFTIFTQAPDSPLNGPQSKHFDIVMVVLRYCERV